MILPRTRRAPRLHRVLLGLVELPLHKSIAAAVLFLTWAIGAPAGDLQALSQAAGTPSKTGGDASSTPSMSQDGRYVLFASRARNLALGTNGQSTSFGLPDRLNVYVRDRQAAVTLLASVSTNGTGADDDAFPLGLSSDGRFVLFESVATNLVQGDTNAASDVFLRDLVLGTTTLISAATNGFAGNGPSRDAVMTPDARFIAFVSSANNLAPGDTNRIPDVFVRDRIGAFTLWISAGAQPTNTQALGLSCVASISDDGRFVSFLSTATNLVPGVSFANDVYVRDLQNGVTHWASTNARALVRTALGVSNAFCFDPVLTATGDAVIFAATIGAWSYPTGIVIRYQVAGGTSQTLVTNVSVPYPMQEEMRSLSIAPDGQSLALVARSNSLYAGVFGIGIRVWNAASNTLLLASGDTNGVWQAFSQCANPALSVDGRYVAFVSSATGLVANGAAPGWHLYRRDLLAGVTSLIDADTNQFGVGVSPLAEPSLSGDGRFAAFESVSDQLVPGDQNGEMDVFVRDLDYGTNELVSVRRPDLPSVFGHGLSAIQPNCLSHDGRFVVFRSTAADLTGATDTNSVDDVFLADRALNQNLLLSLSTNGVAGSGPSSAPVITPSGRHVAFASAAENLVAADTNRTTDVFLLDRQLGSLQVVSRTAAGAFGRSASYGPVVSPDGRFVAFRSKSANLATVPAGDYENLFLSDAQTGALFALTHYGAADAAFAPAGSTLVACGLLNSSVNAALVVWDLGSVRPVFTNSLPSTGRVAISADGTRVACVAAGQLTVLDWQRNTKWTVAAATNTARMQLKFSADARQLLFLSAQALSPADTNGLTDVYLHAFDTGLNRLISASHTGLTAANGGSDMADLSPNGRWVVFRSAATDIVPLQPVTRPNLFLHDLATGQTILLTGPPSETSQGYRPCAWPQFSGDGQTLVFQSWAHDLRSADFNNRGDIFALPLLLVSVVEGAPHPLLQWPAMPGRSFQVQYREGFETGVWQNLPGAFTNAGHKNFLRDTNNPAQRRFYRVVAF